ncbi:MAG: sulfatase [Bacteroidota bacterium]
MPNFILFFTDDQGYGDLSCFGSTQVRTPHIDQLAAEGMKLTSFYVGAPVCTPSRAALMTGCYPKRVDMVRGGIMDGDKPFVVTLAGDPKGMNPSEITIAEVLKAKGYATAILGKWHLGDQPEFLPSRQGFDEFFGIPYSHDIHPFHPQQGTRWNFPPLPLLDGETVIEENPDADYLTQRITDRAVDFIERHQDQPFFLYIPHPMPHNPLHASPEFEQAADDSILFRLAQEKGIDYRLRNHLYPQTIGEIDASVGRVVEALNRLNLTQKTMIVFTTDNGPGSRFATAGPLRGRKGTTFEGGQRVPAVVSWPGMIPVASVSDELLTAMDFLPTFAALAGANVPEDRVIDGKNIWPILSGEIGARTPHDRFFYSMAGDLRAVRSGPWKYHQRLIDRQDPDGPETALYNLESDLAETTDLSSEYPEIVERLKTYLKAYEAELGKGDVLGEGVRPAAWVENPKALGL